MAQTTLPQTRWQEIEKIWKDNRWLYILAGILMGIISVPAIEQITGDLNTLIGNLVPETIGIIFTVLILNRAADNRAKEEIKQQLLAELKSTSVSPAVNALDRLRREGWLNDDYFTSKEGKNLVEANWEGALIGGLNFENANLWGIKFNNVRSVYSQEYKPVNLRNSNLVRAEFENALLVGAHLEGAYLQEAFFAETNLRDAHLEGALLKGAFLKDTNLTNAHLEGASFQDAYISDVKWSDQYLNQPAILPDGTPWTPEEDKRMERFTNPYHPEFYVTLEKINAIRAKLGYEPIIRL